MHCNYNRFLRRPSWARRWLPAILSASTCVVAVGSPAPDKVDLVGYATLALKHSDSAHNLHDDLLMKQLGVDSAKFQYQTKLVPLANFSVGADQAAQRVGVEAQRTIEFGTSFATGVRTNKVTSDVFEVQNPYHSSAFVRVSQGLFRRWGRAYNRFGLSAAELEKRKGELRGRRQRQDIILEAVQRFHAAVLSQHLVDKSQQALDRASKHLTAADARYSVGLVSKVDVYRAELARLSAEDALKDQIRAQQRDDERLHDLAALRELGTLSLEQTIVRMTPVIPENWQETILQHRSDWQTHLIDLEIAGLSLHQAERNTQPDVSIGLIAEREGFGDSVDESAELEQSDLTLQLQLRSTFQLFEENVTLRQQQLNQARLRRDGEASKRRIYREAREAFEDLGAEDRRHRISRERLQQARKALELAEIRYRRGLSNNLDILDAEAAYSAAELDILRTLVAYNVAAVRLGHALGILDVSWLRASLLPPTSAGLNHGRP